LPVQENETCLIWNFTQYAIDVANLHAEIVDALKITTVELTKYQTISDSEDSFCNTFLVWVICFYSFPPCENSKLLPLCEQSCEVFNKAVTTCEKEVNEILNEPFLRNSLSGFKCNSTETYYTNYSQSYFTSSTCFLLPRLDNGKLQYV